MHFWDKALIQNLNIFLSRNIYNFHFFDFCRMCIFNMVFDSIVSEVFFLTVTTLEFMVS